MASAVQVFSFSSSPKWNLWLEYRLWNGQNDRAADIEDGVQRGLGTLPQQAIFENWANGEIEKMSEPVQVYTACQFVCIRIVTRKFRNIDKYIK